MKASLQRILAEVRGATAIEYGLILALMVIALLAGFNNLADVTIGMWNNVSSKVDEAVE